MYVIGLSENWTAARRPERRKKIIRENFRSAKVVFLFLFFIRSPRRPSNIYETFKIEISRVKEQEARIGILCERGKVFGAYIKLYISSKQAISFIKIFANTFLKRKKIMLSFKTRVLKTNYAPPPSEADSRFVENVLITNEFFKIKKNIVGTRWYAYLPQVCEFL